MSKSIKIVATLGLVALVAACGERQTAEEPEMVTVEPTYTGKM